MKKSNCLHEKLHCGLLVLVGAVAAALAPPLFAQPPDGTYEGFTDQSRAASIVVSGGQVVSWTVRYRCGILTATVTVTLGSCPIVNDRFSCGSAFCSPFAASTRLSGTFDGTSVSGTLDVKHQTGLFSSSCCTLSGRSWSASLTGGVCEPAATLGCGSSHSGSNDGAGGSDNIGTYDCNLWTYAGPEVAYVFRPRSDHEVTLSLTALTADLDLLVLRDLGGGCDPEACMADSTRVDTEDESVSFAAFADETYYVLVDGFGGAIGDYSIDLSCTDIFVDGFESGDLDAWAGSPR